MSQLLRLSLVNFPAAQCSSVFGRQLLLHSIVEKPALLIHSTKLVTFSSCFNRLAVVTVEV
jgi:hypothetical protein